jgi:hypothetical protein
MLWLEKRREADEIVTPHKGQRFKQRCAEAGDERIYSSERGMHGCPTVCENSERLPSRKMRKKEGKDDVHVLRKKSEGKSVVKAGVYISTP